MNANELLARWRQGDQQAARELFRSYADRLIALARGRLSAKMTRRVDAEDVVQSVYRSFFVGTREGRYEVGRGGDLWQLLVTITLHKLQRQVERHRRLKRTVEREQSLNQADGLGNLAPEALAREPSPADAVALADEVEQAMRSLPALQRRILELRLQGHNLEEIAAGAQCCERTVRRSLLRIKQCLEQGNGHDAGRL